MIQFLRRLFGRQKLVQPVEPAGRSLREPWTKTRRPYDFSPYKPPPMNGRRKMVLVEQPNPYVSRPDDSTNVAMAVVLSVPDSPASSGGYDGGSCGGYGDSGSSGSDGGSCGGSE